MIRTQLYLTEQEHQSLRHMIAETGKSQSELIRMAIDSFLKTKTVNPKHNLMQAAGIWSSRKNLPDFAAIRQEFDRYSE